MTNNFEPLTWKGVMSPTLISNVKRSVIICVISKKSQMFCLIAARKFHEATINLMYRNKVFFLMQVLVYTPKNNFYWWYVMMCVNNIICNHNIVLWVTDYIIPPSATKIRCLKSQKSENLTPRRKPEISWFSLFYSCETAEVRSKLLLGRTSYCTPGRRFPPGDAVKVVVQK